MRRASASQMILAHPRLGPGEGGAPARLPVGDVPPSLRGDERCSGSLPSPRGGNKPDIRLRWVSSARSGGASSGGAGFTPGGNSGPSSSPPAEARSESERRDDGGGAVDGGGGSDSIRARA